MQSVFRTAVSRLAASSLRNTSLLASKSFASSSSSSSFSSPFTSAHISPSILLTRSVHMSAIRQHGDDVDPNAPDVKVTFVTPEGERISCTGKVGQSILSLAHANDVELEGACEGSLACSTCHVILPEKFYSKLPQPSDEENDMLDMAFGLTETSRLGCQVKLTADLEGVDIQLPSATRNMAVDGHKPQHH